MSDLSYLATLSPEDFEIERNRLIDDALNAIPERHRSACIALQHELSQHRARHSPAEHMAFISARLTENLENLSDALQLITHVAGQAPAVKPPAER